MDIELIFKIAGIGIVTALLNQILARSEKGEYVMIITLAGVVLVFIMLMTMLKKLAKNMHNI